MKELFLKSSHFDKEYYQKNMAENLRLLRAKFSLTQEELCDLIGVSRQTIVQAENSGKISWVTYLALVQLFSRNEESIKFMKLLNIYPNEFPSFEKNDGNGKNN